MTKIPVGQTIRAAYAFTFGEIGTVIGLVWIPAVLSSVAAFLVQRSYGGEMPAPGNVPPGFAYYSLYTVFAAFIIAMIAVALTRQALGLRQGPALAHISIGPAELRVFAGFAGLYLLFFIFVLGIALGVVVLGVIGSALAPTKAVGDMIGAALGGIGTLAGAGALFYAMVRLSFLLVPSAVVDGSFGLSRSWELTKGNFWRIVAIGAATALPIMLAIVAVNLTILGPSYLASIWSMARDQAHLARYAAEQEQLTSAKMPMLLGVSLVLAPISNALLFVPAAFAYRTLVGRSVIPE